VKRFTLEYLAYFEPSGKTMSHQIYRAIALASLLWMLGVPAHSANVPEGFVDREIATGLISPTAIAALPDERLLVVQQSGVIRIIKTNALLPTPLYTFPNVDSRYERGCMGATPDPNFSSNHYLYFYCAIKVDTVSRNRVLRVTEANDVVVPGSERVIFELSDIPVNTQWHMGGALRFGLDGKLYIAVGNHEDSPQPVASSHSQNLATPFGKILRINADGTVPTDNPFYNTPGAYQAVYMLGLRHPFSMDFDPASGLMLVADVGQGTWEEINKGQAGGNYGWPGAEGNSTNPLYLNPLHAYSHNEGCAITGAQFYSPTTPQFPTEYVNKFFYADYCGGIIKYFNPASPLVHNYIAGGINSPTYLAMSPNGSSLYYLARNQGPNGPLPGGASVGKISYTASQAPRISVQPKNITATPQLPATFSLGVNGASGVQWQRNGVDISGANRDSYTLTSVNLTDTGARFRAVVSNAYGRVVSDEATLTVSANRAPIARIDTPVLNTPFAAGDVITFSGSAVDPEEGTLGASALSWRIDTRHDGHAHTFVADLNGVSQGQFTVPNIDTDEANMWLRITLTARDAYGATHTVSQDLFPKTRISQFPLVGDPRNSWGPYEVDRSNGEDGPNDGSTLTISGIPYLHGLGVHAPSDLSFNLNRQCSGNFISDLGVDAETGTKGSVVFRVYLDGSLAYDSGLLRPGDARRTVNVSVANKSILRLVVDDGGDGNYFDHADWAGARVSGCSSTNSALNTVANLQVYDGINLSAWSLQSNLQPGQLVYGDRIYTFSGLPTPLIGSTWLKGANSSKVFKGSPLLNFVLLVESDVYVAVDQRTPLPSWIDASWVDTTQALSINEKGIIRFFSVFKKRFNPGLVSLGGLNNPSVNMYIVVIK
jgi:glucose/arabinose dehydrogenase